MSGFLGISGKTFLISGFANRKSVAWNTAEILEREGAKIIYIVRSQKREAELLILKPEAKILVCDFEKSDQVKSLHQLISRLDSESIHGILHSIAFANYSEGVQPFHQTKLKDYLQATHISSFSLIELANACKTALSQNGSVVTIGISSTEVTAENYGFMAPIKASLEANVRYLAKSFSAFSSIRLLVVFSSLPYNVVSSPSIFSNTPQPPAPGFPLQAPSVKTSISFIFVRYLLYYTILKLSYKHYENKSFRCI